jgi:hypothetical protein
MSDMRHANDWRKLGAVLAALALGTCGAQAVSWNGGGGNANWFNPANWNPAGVPGAGAAVTNATGAILLTNETAVLASFTQTGGSVTFTNWTTRLRATSVDLKGGTLTLPPAFANNQMSNRVWVVCSNLAVAASATLQADSRGYARQNGPGTPVSTNYTFGGSHGGRSSGQSGWAYRPKVCGSLAEPTAPGSGGCSAVGDAARAATTSGGGAIRIDATGEVAIHGTLTANSANAPVTHSSAGSGGSILIVCRTFAGSGTGLLSAKGGNGNNQGGAGGGGRIAVAYNPAAQGALATVNPGVRFTAVPGTGGSFTEIAEPGTLYFPDKAFLSSQMTTQWQGGDIRVPGFTSWSLGSLSVAGNFGLPAVTNIMVTNNLAILAAGKLSLYSSPTNAVLSPYGLVLAVGGELSISNTARMVLTSHPTNGAIPWVTCGNLYVAAGGTIDADYKGYGATGESPYPGPGGGAVETYGAGASHGGHGSIGNGTWTRITKTYGDSAWPLTPGSAGGGAATGLGGHGGGVIAISATNKATIHGTLTADGYKSGAHGGTGSGGSILIACNTFHGSATGLLRARGGQLVQNSGGPGGGGRIAVRYHPVAQAALPQPNPGVAFNAAPGNTGINIFLAEPGSLYLPNVETLFLSSQMSTQWQDVDVVIPAGLPNWSLPSLQIDGKFRIPTLERLQVAGDLTLTSGGRLSLYSHPSNTVSEEIGIRVDVGGKLTVPSGAEIHLVCDPGTGASPYIECGDFDLKSGGVVQADFRGFDMARGPGAGRGTSNGGGGYGGAGSRGASAVGNGGIAYATNYAPIYAGSGAANYGSGGGRGGGAVRIGARNTMAVNGTISANGMSRVVTHAGSGSGGGILLTARSFTGSGILRANGADSSHNGGAGGGGRICVWTPFQSPEYLRLLVNRKLPAGAQVLNRAALWPSLTVTVAAGTLGTNPAEAKGGTIFFGHIRGGTVFMVR